MYVELYISIYVASIVIRNFSSHFPFFVLVDEVTKNENRLRDILDDGFCLQGKTDKTKMKIK